MTVQPRPAPHDPRRDEPEAAPLASTTDVLKPELLAGVDACWCAVLPLGEAEALADNPLLKRPLVLTGVKHMLRPWRTTSPRAAVSILRALLPTLRIRVVNGVDLVRLSPGANIRTACPTRTSTTSSRRTDRSSSRIARTPA